MRWCERKAANTDYQPCFKGETAVFSGSLLAAIAIWEFAHALNGLGASAKAKQAGRFRSTPMVLHRVNMTPRTEGRIAIAMGPAFSYIVRSRVATRFVSPAPVTVSGRTNEVALRRGMGRLENISAH